MFCKDQEIAASEDDLWIETMRKALTANSVCDMHGAVSQNAVRQPIFRQTEVKEGPSPVC